MKIYFYKAQDIGDHHVQSMDIIIDKPIPDIESLEEARDFYQQQADTLASILFKTLPGGTVDALLIELMKKKTSLFKIPHDTGE